MSIITFVSELTQPEKRAKPAPRDEGAVLRTGNATRRVVLTRTIDICRLKSVKKTPRLSPQTIRVLERFASRPSAWQYGYELSRETGLKSGTLYPILMRLAKYGMLETKWLTTEEGVPPRHTYRLTPKGVEVLRELPAKYKLRIRGRAPALNEGGA